MFLFFFWVGCSLQCYAQADSIFIGIFKDKRFNGSEVPKSLRPEYFGEAWGKLPNVSVQYLDIDAIRSYSLIFKNKMDILIFPYGEAEKAGNIFLSLLSQKPKKIVLVNTVCEKYHELKTLSSTTVGNDFVINIEEEYYWLLG